MFHVQDRKICWLLKKKKRKQLYMMRESSRDVRINVLDCGIVVSEFELQRCYYEWIM